MASRYAVGGRTAATAATIDNVGGSIWNPHATKPIYVREVWWFKVTATADNPGLIRTSTKGTVSSEITPDVDNHFDRLAIPPSGALLDVTFTVQPTVQGPYLARANLAAAAGVGFIWVFGEPGIVVPAGTGLAVATPVGVVMQIADLTVVWDE